jgi:hypothetical protein
MTLSDTSARSARVRRAGSLLAAGMVAALLAPAVGSAQQSLAQRIAGVQGEAELRFASRPGVCGNGEGSISFRSPSENVSTGVRTHDSWDYDCEPGPVRVRLTVSNGTVTRVRSYVGRSRDTASAVTDLGVVGAREATDYFLGLARSASEQVARKAIVPAALADSVTVWPQLIELARDRDRPTGVRKPALFWAGQGGTPTADLLDLYREFRDPELERQMIFVLSQRDDSAAVDGLIEIARNDPDHSMRKRAFFWLGQKDDPRVIQLLTSILEK